MCEDTSNPAKIGSKQVKEGNSDRNFVSDYQALISNMQTGENPAEQAKYNPKPGKILPLIHEAEKKHDNSP